MWSCAVTCQRNGENYSRKSSLQLKLASLIRPFFYCSWPRPQQLKLGAKRNVVRWGPEWQSPGWTIIKRQYFSSHIA
jgi:hypothetical protein